MTLACQLCGGRAHQMNGGLWQHFCLGESCPCPQFSPWCQTIQFHPICPWCLFSCYPSARAQMKWVRVSLCASALRGPTWDSTALSPPSATIPTDFYSQKLLGFLFPDWNPGLGGLVWRLGPFAPQREPLQQRYPPQNPPRGCVTNLFCISAPPTNLSAASSLNPWM